MQGSSLRGICVLCGILRLIPGEDIQIPRPGSITVV